MAHVVAQTYARTQRTLALPEVWCPFAARAALRVPRHAPGGVVPANPVNLYDNIYADFAGDAELAVRQETCGEDLGQAAG